MIILERLEKIDDGCFCTDYVGDIRNFLLKKPAPYRVVYDKKNDIYAIGDAEKYTHKDIARKIVDSGYIYDINRYFERDLENMRKRYWGYYGSDADVYAEIMYASGDMLGFIFMPNDYDYFKYEDSGFYKVETKITTGSVYTRKKDYFSSDGYFSDLYNSINRVGGIVKDYKKSLESIWKDAQRFGNKADIEYFFKEVAFDNGHSADDIFKFLQKQQGNSLEDIYTHWKRKMGDLAPKAFFYAAKKYNYSDDEINDYLEYEVGVDRIENTGGDVYYD